SPDEDEEKSAALLHSKTGAAVAKSMFGLTDSVCEAVKWHTTGKPDMSILEKIIYLADFIEPTRSFEGLDRVRLLAYEDIDRAIAEAMRLSLENMGERGVTPHRNTVDALEYLTEKIKDRKK
ncbi:MAG: bis(5'-nucleosyl)-tetraphosphatase (symmetrical) YqeK, partial [Oscillospiraceae bacterium]|nr:bis(5'-nucleosyl)-tetraphosphatase (symmetrical) YqeK [Oscillospiraceae bacterium]